MNVKDGIIGFIVGDALGLPVEFHSKNQLRKNPVTTMTGYRTFKVPRGTWSDDSSLTLATIASIVNKQGVDYEDVMNEFSNWFFNGKYTQYHNTFDYGVTTSTPLYNYKRGIPALECGGKSDRYLDSGSLMRMLPLAFLQKPNIERVENFCRLTHEHEIPKIACNVYVEIGRSMTHRDLSIEEHVIKSINEVMKYYKDSKELQKFKRIFDNNYVGGVYNSRYVVDTLECCIYCLENTNSYKDAVLKAVNLGSDCDTLAALCGGLAGIYYGIDEIPIYWIRKIPYINKVIPLCEKYEKFCKIYWG